MYAIVLFPEDLALPCPFIIAGVERPLEAVLSISIRVLLILLDSRAGRGACVTDTTKVLLLRKHSSGLEEQVQKILLGILHSRHA